MRTTLAAVAMAVCPGLALGDDDVLYRLGGAEPISIGATSRATTLDLSVGVGWRTNMSCGDFDVAASIGNQLNGITGAFQQVMGNVIDTAQGLVASLPALVIQRLNPGLYDLLQNGILEAGQEFRVAQLRCEEMTKKASQTLASDGWAGVARADHWREQIGLNDDPLEIDADTAPDDGLQWVGGNKKGGVGQDPIDVGGDVAAAGINTIVGRPADATGPITCQPGDVICEEWGDPDDLKQWMERVVGKIVIQTCEGCPKVETKAGMGLQSEVTRVREVFWVVLEPLMQAPFRVPGVAEMELLNQGGYVVSREMIEAMRAESNPAAIGQRVSAELAVARVMDQASLARRALLAGAKEPNVANNEIALKAVQGLVGELDSDIRQIEFEMRVKSALGGGTPAVLVMRNTVRRGVPVVESEPGGVMREGALDRTY